MKLFIGLLFLLTLNAEVFASGVNWTSVKACSQGYDVQMMTRWGNSEYATKFVMSIRKDAYESLLNQLRQNIIFTSSNEFELQQFEVSTPSFGKFEATLSFGKVVATELNNGTNVQLKIYDLNNKEIANYYFDRCY